MSKKYVYGIINERSNITDAPIRGGRIVQTYRDDLTNERVLIIQTSLGTIYETFDKYFITDANEVAEIINEISKKVESYKDKYKKANETAERCTRYLYKQATNAEPNIKKCFEIQGQLEKATEYIDKIAPKLEMIRESLLTCYEISQKMQ